MSCEFWTNNPQDQRPDGACMKRTTGPGEAIDARNAVNDRGRVAPTEPMIEGGLRNAGAETVGARSLESPLPAYRSELIGGDGRGWAAFGRFDSRGASPGSPSHPQVTSSLSA